MEDGEESEYAELSLQYLKEVAENKIAKKRNSRTGEGTSQLPAGKRLTEVCHAFLPTR